MGAIYKITNSVNGKVYIGKTTKTTEIRFNQHLKNAKNNSNGCPYLYNAINKYGNAKFSVETLLESDDRDYLSIKEIDLIEKYNSTNHNNGYNIAKGGEGCAILEREFTAETRIKIAKSVSEYYHNLSVETKHEINENRKKGLIEHHKKMSKEQKNSAYKNLNKGTLHAREINSKLSKERNSLKNKYGFAIASWSRAKCFSIDGIKWYIGESNTIDGLKISKRFINEHKGKIIDFSNKSKTSINRYSYLVRSYEGMFLHVVPAKTIFGEFEETLVI